MSLTSVIRYVRTLDSTATDGSGKTGIAFGSFTAKYLTEGGTLTSLTTETITTLGTYQAPTSAAHVRIKELSSSDPTKGVYEVHFHNTQVAITGKRLWLFLSAAGAAVQPLELDLITTAALPSAAAGASGGLPTADASNQVQANLTQWRGTTPFALQTNGAVIADLYSINNVSSPAPDVQIAATFWRDTTAGDFTVAGSIGKSILNGVTLGTGLTIATATNLTNAPTSGDFTATMKTSIGTAVAASAVASVTGSVGSISGVTFPTNFADLAITASTGRVTAGTVSDKTGYTLTVTPPTAAAIATAVLTDTTASDFTTAGSPGKILVAQLGGTFTTTSSSVFTTASLANAPGGGGSVTVGGYASGQDPATLVLDAVAASHNTSGSIGQKINAAGGAADPLLNPVPGSYAAGTAGYNLGSIPAIKTKTDLITAGGVVNVSVPVAADGTVELVPGDDYRAADGRALLWTGSTANVWPDLTGSSVAFVVYRGSHTYATVAGAVVTPTGTQVLRAEPLAADTGVLTAGQSYSYKLVATLASGHVVTLVADKVRAVP